MEWYYLVTLAAMVNAAFIIITKKELVKEHSMEFSSANSVLVFLFSLPLLFFIDLNVSSSQLALIYISSLLFTVAFLYNIKAIRHMDISIVAPLSTFGTITTAILSMIMLNEFLSIKQLVGLLFLLAGAYVLQTKSKNFKLVRPLKTMFTSKHMFYLFSSLILFSLSFVIMRFLTNDSAASIVSPLSYIFMLNAFVSLNFLVITTIFFKGFDTYKHGLRPLSLAAISAFLILFYRILQLSAISKSAAKLPLVTGLGEIHVLFAVLIGGKLFHEHNLKRKVIGTLIILAGVFIVLSSL